MRIIRDLSSCPPSCQGAVIALGNFDGLHKGHRTIIAETTLRASLLQAPSAVMTFEPHPREFFGSVRTGLRIYSLRQKLALLRECGIDIVYLIRFNHAFSGMTADDFIGSVLHKALRAKSITTGENFAFGKGRGGDSLFLSQQTQAQGMGYMACPPVREGNQVISSSVIRDLLASGDVAKANRMLEKPYHIYGRVVHGEQRGRSIGFPTANIKLGNRFNPRFGVYAATIMIDGRVHKAVANLGIRPTFGQNAPLLEVHVFDFQNTLYEKTVRVELIAHIRDEKKFENLLALKDQIAHDCKKAMEIL